jgi:hypothetical protein
MLNKGYFKVPLIYGLNFPLHSSWQTATIMFYLWSLMKIFVHLHYLSKSILQVNFLKLWFKSFIWKVTIQYSLNGNSLNFLKTSNFFIRTQFLGNSLNLLKTSNFLSEHNLRMLYIIVSSSMILKNMLLILLQEEMTEYYHLRASHLWNTTHISYASCAIGCPPFLCIFRKWRKKLSLEFWYTQLLSFWKYLGFELKTSCLLGQCFAQS